MNDFAFRSPEPWELTEVRLQLLANGYEPIPIIPPGARHASPGKAPNLPGWQTIAITEDVVRDWATDRIQRLNPGTGLRCGTLIGVDIDVLLPELAARIKEVAFAMLGTTPLTRIGRAPKLLLCYRVLETAGKLMTPRLLLPDGTHAQVEVLGRGQQFVSFGSHPDTRQPYSWPDQTPLDVPLANLPIVGAVGLLEFVAAAETVLRGAGGMTEAERRKGSTPEQTPSAAPQRSPFGFPPADHKYPPPPREDVESALLAFPNTCDWHDWVKIGAAIFDALGDDGEDLFVAWSAQSPRDDPTATRAKWASFRTSPMNTTAATLFYFARQKGWRRHDQEWWDAQEPGFSRDRGDAGNADPADEAGPRGANDAFGTNGNGTNSREEPESEIPDLNLATADTMPAPPFPLGLFPGDWTSWIQCSATRAGAPCDYVACSILAVMGAAIGNARWGSPWEGWAHPPVVWVANVGLPSAGKSPGMEAATRPLSELAGELNDDWEERLHEYRTTKQEAKEKRELWESKVKKAVKDEKTAPQEPEGAREPDPPHKRRVYSTDPTVEKARDLSVTNQRGLMLHRDELAGWLAVMGKYGNGTAGADRAFWLQAYEGGRWASDRVKDGDDAPDIPHLTWGIVGGFQPDRLASALLAGDDDGMAARFIYTWPAPPADVSERPDGSALPFDLKEQLRRLRDLSMPNGGPVTLRFDDDAAVAMQEWRREVKEMEPNNTGLFLSWTGKLPGFAVRLAVIFAYLAWLVAPDGKMEPDSITRDDLSRALGFLRDYAVPMARRAFGEAALPEAERDARRLARWYLRQARPRPDVLNARALRRMSNGPGIASAPRIEAALAELHELRWVQAAPGRGGGSAGRQRGDWNVNPVVRDANT